MGKAKQNNQNKKSPFDFAINRVYKKLALVFALVIIVFGASLASFILNSQNLKSDYSEMVTKLFIADQLQNDVQEVINMLNKSIQLKKTSYLDPLPDTMVRINENTAYLNEKVLDTKTELALKERRMIIIDKLNENVTGYLDAVAKKDLQARQKYFDGIATGSAAANTLIKAHISDYTKNEIVKMTEIKTKIEDKYNTSLTLALIVIAIGVSISLILLIIVVSRISKTINKLTKTADTIGKGDLSGADLTIKSKDELLILGSAFNLMKSSLRGIIQNQKEMVNNINGASNGLARNVAENITTAEDVAKSIEEMMTSIMEQKKEMQVMKSKVGDIAEHSTAILVELENQNKETNHAVKLAKNGENQMVAFVAQMAEVVAKVDHASEAMETINQVSDNMNQILDQMDYITKQTNLLSINAAIEASRAGEQGRSFALVAQEIRKLAENSGNLSKNIRQLINDITKSLENVTGSMIDVNQQLVASKEVNQEVSHHFKTISETNTSVASNNGRIVNGIATLGELVEHINKLVDHNFALSNNNQLLSETINAAMEEELASFEEIHEATVQLNHMTEEALHVVDKYKVN